MAVATDSLRKNSRLQDQLLRTHGKFRYYTVILLYAPAVKKDEYPTLSIQKH